MEPYEIEARKSAIRFVCIALAVQILLCLLWSPAALDKLFPLYARAAAETVTVDDNSYTEYYPIRRRTAGAELRLIVIGADFACRESYALLPDLIAALKNDVNIGSILIDGVDGADAAAAVVSAEDEESLEACAAQISAPAEYVDFLKKLNRMKADYPPQRQFTGLGCDTGADRAQALLSAAEKAFSETGRQVLMIVDTAMLDTDAPLRIAAEKWGELSVCIQCRYAERWRPFSEKTPEILIVDSDTLWLFDDLYLNAARKADGQLPERLYSEMYSTDVSFIMYDCTPVG
ncbi:MAG: hypothetical protein E7662_11385 [Ruminococcaceae bacterium]|nr:hypothetical protein [Oscillospiraceae bacterium]